MPDFIARLSPVAERIRRSILRGRNYSSFRLADLPNENLEIVMISNRDENAHDLLESGNPGAEIAMPRQRKVLERAGSPVPLVTAALEAG